MRKNYLWLIILPLLCACQRKLPAVLFEIPDKTTSKEISLSDILGPAKLTHLEVTDKSLIGLVGKVIKRDGLFYILSDMSRILTFNEQGEFISSLEKRGRGAGEYLLIGDFDIFSSGDQTEIWLCDERSIKIYDAATSIFKRSIDFDFVVNKIVKIDNTLLLLTGQNDNFLTICDVNGNISKTFLERDPGSIMFRPVNFVEWQGAYIYQVGLNSSCVTYYPQKEIFKDGLLFAGPSNAFTKEINEELTSKYEQDYLSYVNSYFYPRTFRNVNGHTIALFRDGAKSYIYRGKAGDPNAIQYIDLSDIKNDLQGSNNLKFLQSINIGESRESLLGVIEPTDIEWPEGIVAEDQNIMIIEWSMK